MRRTDADLVVARADRDRRRRRHPRQPALSVAIGLAAAWFACSVVSVHDGDGPVHCADGRSLRLAGIQAPDFAAAEPCLRRRPGYVCDDRRAIASRDLVRALLVGRTLRCRSLGASYRRTVADCWLADGRSVSCAIVASGAASRWDGYWRRYGFGQCPRKRPA